MNYPELLVLRRRPGKPPELREVIRDKEGKLITVPLQTKATQPQEKD